MVVGRGGDGNAWQSTFDRLHGGTDRWDVLFVDASRFKIIVIPIIIDIVGYVLMTIPYLSWDYDDRKQNMVMEVLKARERATHGSLDGTEAPAEPAESEVVS